MNGAAVVDAAVCCPLGTHLPDVVRRWRQGSTAVVPDALTGPSAPPPTPSAGPHVRLLAPQSVPAWDAAAELLRRVERPAAERTGLYFGYGGLRVPWAELAPALAHQRPDAAGAWERGLRGLHPFWMLRNLSNGLPGLLAAEFRITGDGVTTAGATAGVAALVSAIRALEAGVVDAALVVAADDLTAPEVVLDRAARGLPGAPGAGAGAVWLRRPADAPGAPRLRASTSGADLAGGHPLHVAAATGDLGAAEALVAVAVGWAAGGEHRDPAGRWTLRGS